MEHLVRTTVGGSRVREGKKNNKECASRNPDILRAGKVGFVRDMEEE